MIIELNDEIWEKINTGYLKARDLVEYILSNCDYRLHFRLCDIKSKELTKENIYNELSIDKLYNDDNKNVKKAYLKDNKLYLEF
jgi:hypothetical protein